MYSDKNIGDRLLMSSQDATKISLTIKGLALQLVPVILMVTSNLAGFESWDAGLLNSIIEQSNAVVSAAVELISVVMVAWGLIRKLAPKY